MHISRRRTVGFLATLATLAGVTAGCGALTSQPAPTEQANPRATRGGPELPPPTLATVTPSATSTPSPTGTSPTTHPKPPRTNPGPGNGPRPNFVLITTDDQRADDMQWMPYTRELLGGHGVTFTDAISPHPLCCPARAELMTGQYGQNSGVTHNDGISGGFEAMKDPAQSLAAWLQADGYRTAMTGKYLNDYKPKHGIQTGWTHWNPSIKGIYAYRDTTFYNDGKPARHLDHSDDVIVDYTTEFIREFSAENKPFFVWASQLAPHVVVRGPERGYALPAPRHAGTFNRANPARTNPSYATGVVDGPPVGDLTKMGLMDEKYRTGIEALQAVDEGVKSIVDTLRATGELENTYIIFASDNGLHLGEHGLNGKNTIFEEAVRIPLLVRTPTAQSVFSPMPVTLVDIPATIVDLAAADPTRLIDGDTFAPVLAGREQGWRDTQLIQTGTDIQDSAGPGWEVRGVRTSRWTYGENLLTGLVELYDRDTDPHQLINLAGVSTYKATVSELARRLNILRACAGDVCRRSFAAPIPAPTPAP